MFYDKRVRGKNIFCLETHWKGETFSPIPSLKPILDYVTIARGTRYTYRLVHTKEEIDYNLRSCDVKRHKLLFFGFHGKPSTIFVGAKMESDLSIDEIGEMMGDRFQGYGVHFSSCSFLKSNETVIKNFIRKTGVKFVSGYMQGVDWIESGTMDLAFLGRWFMYKNVKSMFASIEKSYPDFISENGYTWVVPD